MYIGMEKDSSKGSSVRRRGKTCRGGVNGGGLHYVASEALTHGGKEKKL